MNAKEKAAGSLGGGGAFCFKCQANNRKEASLSRTQRIARCHSALQARVHAVAVVVAATVAFVVVVASFVGIMWAGLAMAE